MPIVFNLCNNISVGKSSGCSFHKLSTYVLSIHSKNLFLFNRDDGRGFRANNRSFHGQVNLADFGLFLFMLKGIPMGTRLTLDYMRSFLIISWRNSLLLGCKDVKIDSR